MLCQLSYAPRLRPLDCSRPLPGIDSGVSGHRPEEPAEDERDDELLEQQEGKGYGEDEGEREQALDEFLDK